MPPSRSRIESQHRCPIFSFHTRPKKRHEGACVRVPSHLHWTSVDIFRYMRTLQPESHRKKPTTGVFTFFCVATTPTSSCGVCSSPFFLEKRSAIPFPRRLGSRSLCTHDIIALHTLGHDVRTNPRLRDFTEIRIRVATVRRFRG